MASVRKISAQLKSIKSNCNSVKEEGPNPAEGNIMLRAMLTLGDEDGGESQTPAEGKASDGELHHGRDIFKNTLIIK